MDVADACLARIGDLNPRINAFITVAEEQTRAAAAVAESELRAGHWRGPMHGVPVAVKDFYDTAGINTTAAFDRFAHRIPAKDADVVARLKASGAIVIGKTNMDTLGMGTTGLVSFYGPVMNPWNADYITGGSSSGSAAAVASGMCYATVDTDAIGSCRLPAACCGVVGFKGTYGLISGRGILEGEAPPDEMIQWFSHPGVTTRSVEDTAIVLDVLKERNVNTPARRLRIAVASNFAADENVTAVFAKAVETIAGLGHTMTEAMIPFAGANRGIGNIERARASIATELFEKTDLLLLPTMTTAVPLVSAAEGNPQALSAGNTVFANYYGIPAMTVPCGCDSNGLPVGLQIVGRPWSDGDVLSLAKQFIPSAVRRPGSTGSP